MIGVPIEMPETCEACLCNVHECYCGVTGNFFNFDETTRRADDCPLVDLSGEHVPVNNVGNIEYIEKKKVIDALEKVAGFFPYKVPGNADTYLPYNEAWNDAIGRAEMEIESLTSADVAQVREEDEAEKTMDDDFVIDSTTYGYSEGKWIMGKYTNDDLRYNDYSYRCNRCGKIVDFEENYCPNCRAKMHRAE